MARPARLVVDETPLTGRRVDVGARAGWLLRMSRLAAARSLEEMAGGLARHGVRVSVPQLSRIETGALRMGVVTDAYETVLGIPPGGLRAPIDVMARTYRSADADQQPELERPGLAAFDAAVAPVLDGVPLGGDWLRFARAHQHDGVGLPSRLMEPLLTDLASQTVRGVGPAFVTRYEALTRMRLGSYGELVAQIVREAVDDPGHQALVELMSAASERPSASLLAWAARLLDHERDEVAGAAGVALTNARAIGGVPRRAWAPVPAAFVTAWTSPRGTPDRRGMLSRLLANLPPQLREEIAQQLGPAVPRAEQPVDWTPSRRNRHYAIAERVANEACRRTGLPEQPMLIRLAFEMVYDYRAERAVTSAWLVGAAPVARHLLPLLLDLAADPAADQVTRRGATAAVSSAQGAGHDLDPAPLLASDDPAVRASALRIVAHAGQRLAPPLRQRMLAEQPAPALYALGMAGDPGLVALADDARCPADVRLGARWWLSQGGRVLA